MLYLVQSSKTGPPQFLNYDDVCYSTGDRNAPSFAMEQIADWGVVVCASANAIEVSYCFSSA